jgi:hypothetical protein
MHFPTRYFVLLPLSAAISLLTISCSESKVSQCNKIREVANEPVNAAKPITNSAQARDPKVIRQLADVIEKASQEMKAIDVKDAKLKDYQAGYVNMYRNIGKAMRDLEAAGQQNNRLAFEAASTNFRQATIPEAQLVTDVNKYCFGK